MRDYLKIIKAFSDMTRLRILKMLQMKSMCVCEITDVLGLAPSTVSKHLTVLQNAELVQDRKQGKWVNYSLSPERKEKFDFKISRIILDEIENDRQIRSDRKKAKKADRFKLCR